MPFRMALIMDQRRVPTILTNFGNSALPLGVRQVQIYKREQAGALISGGGADMGRPGAVGERGASNIFDQFDVAVEIRGRAYIFRQPDATLLPKVAVRLAQEEAGRAAAELEALRESGSNPNTSSK